MTQLWQMKPTVEKKRAHPFYKTTLWKRRRLAFLAVHPTCWRCWHDRGKLTPATVVHHVQPHGGDWEKFRDEDNWRASCKRCHDSTEQRIERTGYDRGVGKDGWPTDPLHPINKEGMP